MSYRGREFNEPSKAVFRISPAPVKVDLDGEDGRAIRQQLLGGIPGGSARCYCKRRLHPGPRQCITE